ncbi:FMN-linked oxidoreductase [Rhodotorula sp. JG-1b]|nr:FMN-linked oxidoreductase [Rhodotorula sp. JG-1b]
MPSRTAKEEIQAIKSAVQLPCGRSLPNRLVKASFSRTSQALYESWSAVGYGMIITGNVQVSPDHLGLPFDIAVPSSEDVDPVSAAAVRRGFSRWAKACKPSRQQNSTGPSGVAPPPLLAIMQLNHPGRQSMRRFCGRPASEPALAPSAVPLVVGTHPLARWVSGLLWGSPRAMTEGDIDRVVEQFVDGARLAHETGWDGVELHASHGYLLAQFMSPKVNRRTDAYGGSARHRLTLLFRIIDAIRAELPLADGFVLGVKLNSSDYVKGGLTEQDALDNVKWIAEHGGVDFIEISGGDYERPGTYKRLADLANI